MDKDGFQKVSLKLGIVGGGRACRFFLNMLNEEPLPYLDIRLVGVCDVDPDAEGLQLAREMGIFTTTDFKELFKIENLDGIIELTNSRDVLLDLIRHRPKQVGILEHNISRLLRNLFLIDQRLKSAEHEAQTEKMVADFLIHEAKQGILVLQPDFTIVDINDVCLESIGKSKAAVIGAKCFEVIYGQSIPCSNARTGFECPMLETLKTGKSAQVIQENPVSPNQSRFCNIVTYPVKNAQNNVIRVIEIWRDITKALAERWNHRLQTLKSDLSRLVQEDRMISLGKLVASCVHEINNPIQGLLTFGHLSRELLDDDRLTPRKKEQLREYADLMCRELDRCGQIVSGLLSFSRQSNQNHKNIDLNEVLRTVGMLVGHKAKLQNVHLEWSLSAEPLVIQGDENLLQQCFLNLIFNGLEAMAAVGHGVLAIETRLGPEGGHAHVCIQDDGCGITADHIDHIFEPFFTTKETGEGTGLGLSIVYGAVKNHQGSITVESAPAKGSAFKLIFPLHLS